MTGEKYGREKRAEQIARSAESGERFWYNAKELSMQEIMGSQIFETKFVVLSTIRRVCIKIPAEDFLHHKVAYPFIGAASEIGCSTLNLIHAVDEKIAEEELLS